MAKIPCNDCGALILDTTHKKNDGVCMRCISGAVSCKVCGVRMTKQPLVEVHKHTCIRCLKKQKPTGPTMVDYRGITVVKGWPEKIQAAQSLKFYKSKSNKYVRIKFGDESNKLEPKELNCPDCMVEKTELHVPMCDHEECPKCKRQHKSCGCELEVL